MSRAGLCRLALRGMYLRDYEEKMMAPGFSAARNQPRFYDDGDEFSDEYPETICRPEDIASLREI